MGCNEPRHRLHWWKWPAIGGILFRSGLNVGWNNIAELLRGDVHVNLLAGLFIVTPLMWAFSVSPGHREVYLRPGR